VLLTTWIILTISIHGTLGHFWGEDKDKDAWIYSMQASMFELAKQQGGLEPVKWDQLGYAGSAIIEVWIDQHCSLKDEGKTKYECHQCYIDADDNVQKVIECTEKYLPEEYMECWNKKHSNDSVEAELNIMRCFKETWQNFEFQDCLKEVETWFRDENTQKSKLLPDFEDMGWVKWCMTNKKQELKSQIHGKILNRMFGGGQCGSTALALMNMIPMPFEQLSQNTDYGRPSVSKKNMHSDNLVNKFLKFLDPPKFIKLRPMESNFKGEKRDQDYYQDDENDDDDDEC